MSRIRTTLDSVTKVVGSTDFISKFSRLKPGSSAPSSTHVEKVPVKADNITSNNTATASPPETTMKKEEEGEKTTAEEEPDKQWQQVTEKPYVVTKTSTSSVNSAANVSGPSSSSTVAKQTMQVFHPAALSTNMDETYKTLALHINSYFGTSAHGEESDKRPQQQHGGEDEPVSESVLHPVPQQTGDHIPILSPVAQAKSTEAPTASPVPLSPPVETPSSSTPASEGAVQSVPVPTTSPKKGFTHYLSYPRPSVQAFVGSYIAPLVPKFIGDSKTIADDKDKSSSAVSVEESTVDKAEEREADSEEAKADKVKQQLLTQREKVQCSTLMTTDCQGQYLLFLISHGILLQIQPYFYIVKLHKQTKAFKRLALKKLAL